MEIYHGSYTPIPSPEIIPREFTKDFGEGFYCTAIKKQALHCLTYKGCENY